MPSCWLLQFVWGGVWATEVYGEGLGLSAAITSAWHERDTKPWAIRKQRTFNQYIYKHKQTCTHAHMHMSAGPGLKQQEREQ